MENFNHDEIFDNRKTPILKDFKCKVVVYIIGYGLTLLPFIIFFYVWLFYNFLIAVRIALFTFIASSIILSKLRLSSIPLEELEFSHSNIEIAKWFVFMHIFDILPTNKFGGFWLYNGNWTIMTSYISYAKGRCPNLMKKL